MPAGGVSFGMAGDGPESDRVRIGFPSRGPGSQCRAPGGLALAGRLARQQCRPHPCGPEHAGQELNGGRVRGLRSMQPAYSRMRGIRVRAKPAPRRFHPESDASHPSGGRAARPPSPPTQQPALGTGPGLRGLCSGPAAVPRGSRSERLGGCAPKPPTARGAVQRVRRHRRGLRPLGGWFPILKKLC